jgi:hypothetical protein
VPENAGTGTVTITANAPAIGKVVVDDRA